MELMFCWGDTTNLKETNTPVFEHQRMIRTVKKNEASQGRSGRTGPIMGQLPCRGTLGQLVHLWVLVQNS